MLRQFCRALLLTLCWATPTLAADPPQAPILRIETGAHTTLIRRLVVDAPRQRLITCSDDKTIRVWQLPQGRLVATLRVPIGPGHEGQLFGLAVSPDGTTVVAGGWTGWDWDGKASVYLFDIASGELVRRIGGFADAIGALAWLPDGRHLAVGLQARAGLQIVRVDDGGVVASDPEYNDKIMDIDAARHGRLAVVALDGMIRLYGPDFRLLGRKTVPGGKRPASLRFAPDAARIAVGFADAPVVAVLGAHDLGLLFHPDVGPAPGQASFNTVVWSSDGARLYAGGDHGGVGRNSLFRWPAAGRGQPERIVLTDQRISEIQQLPNGSIAYAAEDPGFGVLDADGKVRVWRGPDIADFSAAGSELLAAPDGGLVRVPLERGGARSAFFNVTGDADTRPADKDAHQLAPPLLTAAEFKIAVSADGFSVKVNGHEVKLDDYERLRSHAIAHDRRFVLLGTEWALRLVERSGKEGWQVRLPAVAWALNVTRNGRLALAALSDGTLRWYRISDGRQMLAYFPHRNGGDWIAWTPEGYYKSSLRGDNHVGWHLNRGREASPDFHRAVQFERMLYRPDVVHAAFEAAARPKTRALTAPVNANFDVARLREIAPPRLRLRSLRLEGAERGQPRLALEVSGEASSLRMRDYTVFVNEVPVTAAAERRLEGGEANRFARSVTVDLTRPSNDIRVEAFNGVSMGVAETLVALPEGVAVADRPGELFVLAIGANAFANLPPVAQLAYAANDAEKFAAALARRGRERFRQVHTLVITDHTAQKPERESVVRALDFVLRARAQDTVMVFLASHGLSDPAGNYWFVPRDAAAEDVEAVKRGGAGETLVPWTAFFETLRQAAGRRILVVDTCHARNIEGRFQPYSLMKRSVSSLFSLVVAAKGDEESQEYAPAEHGLFTHALLSAMAPGSDADRDGLVSLREWFQAATPVVEALHDRSAGSQTPQLIAPRSLEDTVLFSAAALAAIDRQ